MLESLLDNLTTERIEIDMIAFSGIEFRHVDNRVMSLRLVQLGLSGAAMFEPSGEVLQHSATFRGLAQTSNSSRKGQLSSGYQG
jgi:hypothetical protein